MVNHIQLLGIRMRQIKAGILELDEALETGKKITPIMVKNRASSIQGLIIQIKAEFNRDKQRLYDEKGGEWLADTAGKITALIELHNTLEQLPDAEFLKKEQMPIQLEAMRAVIKNAVGQVNSWS